MIKVFISQPMNGRTDEEIVKARKDAIDDITRKIGNGFEVLENFFEDYGDVIDNETGDGTGDRTGTDGEIVAPGYIPLKLLAKSIDILAEANVVYFTWDYYSTRGCNIEYEIARNYGKVIIVQERPLTSVITRRAPEIDSEKE